MMSGCFGRVLTDIRIDQFHFRATPNLFGSGGCILWLRDSSQGGEFEALGRFSEFDKRVVLEFVTKYSTCEELRELIEKKRFEAWVDNVAPRILDRASRVSESQRKVIYRQLFDLDGVFGKSELDRKRRIMARRFHPDAGGCGQRMSIINQAYECLVSYAVN